MSKYIKLEDAIRNINLEVTGRKEYTGDMKANLFFALDDLPTIEVSEDCISREWLRNMFGLSEKTRKWGGDHSGYNTMMLYEIQDYIEDAPSVVPKDHIGEPTEMVGEWKHYMGDLWTCTACGESLMCDDIECNNYCPNCGADMRGSDNE